MGTRDVLSTRIFALMTVVPALVLLAWLAVALPLLLADAFRPLPATLLFLPVLATVLFAGGRAAIAYADGMETRVSWRLLSWTAVAAVAFLAIQRVFTAEPIIVRRDQSTYTQFAIWLSDHGSLPVPRQLWAFGGSDPALDSVVESGGFYQSGDAVVPQFLAGLPLILTPAGWAGGVEAMLNVPPILGACAVLSFAGLVARLVSPGWAPAGALLLASTLPMMYVSRAPFSETVALVLLFGGLALLHDSRAAGSRLVRPGAFVAGLVLGLGVLVRIDALRELLPMLVFAGVLGARRDRAGLPLLAGLLLGGGAGLVEAFVLSRPYLRDIHASFDPLLALVVVTSVVVLAGVAVPRRFWESGRMRRLAGWTGRVVRERGRMIAVLPVLVVAAFAARPLFQTVTRTGETPEDRASMEFVAAVQRRTGLAAEPGRIYYENSLQWVWWYIGVPALLLAVAGAAFLTYRLCQGRLRVWLLPYSVICWSAVLVLWRPAIVPDHPWASRRLIVTVLPGLLLLALLALDRIVRRLKERDHRTAPYAAPVAVVVMLAPMFLTSIFLILPTDGGSLRAVRGLCARIPADGSALILDRATGRRLAQVVRGTCERPAAVLRTEGDRAAVQRVSDGIRRAGRRPLLLARDRAALEPFGRPVQVMRLRSVEDGQYLDSPPKGALTYSVDVWAVQP
ncbi:hypothetical protein [Spirillospora sp. CA-294931]|uniref:hypothetical protein n=1 Tax=Spirillospora sp. CA-294931 TaxID=3240042 RepID=UPI003D93CAA3